MNSKKSLLIVDDDIAHRTMLRILLGQLFEILEVDIYYPAHKQCCSGKRVIFLHLVAEFNE